MSAICGVLRLDGADASATDARVALDRMRHRGPDGLEVWADGPLALGQAYLQTVPERETLPLVAGSWTVVADARLDNRTALLSKLRADLRALGLDGEAPPDGALILAAVARWGERAPEHLLGDFAFAAWDARAGTLLLARDPLGVRQLVLHHAENRHLVFATEPSALLGVPGVPEEIDGDRVAEVLSGRLFDVERSIFLGLVKLPAGHTRIATPERVHPARRYWTLRIGPTPPGDAAEGFAHLFTEAVEARIRSSHAVAAELSGGLDSSSVTVVAARALGDKPLHTLSAAFRVAAGSDEGPYIDAVLESLRRPAIPHTFYPEDEHFVPLYADLFARVDEGRTNGNHHFNYLSFREAHRAGARVVLTGQDGDTTVGHGWKWFAEQTRAGDNWTAMRAEADRVVARLAAEKDAYDGQMTYSAPGQLVNAYSVPVLQAWAREKRIGSILRATRGLRSAFGASPRVIARILWPDLVRPRFVLEARDHAIAEAAGRSAIPPTLREPFRASLAARIAANGARRRAAERDAPAEAEAQRRALTSGYLDGSFERLDLYGAAWQVEARHPFMHLPLIEFCLALPSDEKLRDGYSRSVMRRALLDLLPAKVAWRANKSNLTAPQGLFLSSDPERTQSLLADLGPAERFIDAAALRALWDRRASLSEWEEAWLTNALSLIVWLKTRSGVPV